VRAGFLLRTVRRLRLRTDHAIRRAMGSLTSGAWAACLCGLLVAACSGRVEQSGDALAVGGTGGADSLPVHESGGTGGADSLPVHESGGTGGAGSLPVHESGGMAGASASAGGGSSDGGADATSGGQGGAMPPEGPTFWWDCPLEAWGDGRCDCGCGQRDIDCSDGDITSCEVCDGPGSCNGAPCPGRIDPVNNQTCDPPPFGWACPWLSYADGLSCDCGCGVPDPDCEDEAPETCDTCKLPGSCAEQRNDGCDTALDPADSSRCYIPTDWICYANYGDGVCDCGCGAQDVDCASSALEDCEACEEGCSGSACPGKISPGDNALCTPPPPGWRCPEYRYRDTHFCDCGCGVVDPDCASSAVESCEWCNDEGSCSIQTCPGSVDPTNNALCHQPAPPSWWTCSASDYADGTICDCGCGGYDLDCPNEGPEVCEDCHSCGSCPDSINPLSNASCL
jgi:hypothetical protein